MKNKTLIIGALGQLGTVLSAQLRELHGSDQVVASDIHQQDHYDGIYEVIDATDAERIAAVIRQHEITEIYHLAAILSAKGEEQPLRTWHINMSTLFNVLEVAKSEGIKRVFFPSSIAVFGAEAPRLNTPNHAYLDPATVYGMSKSAGELWAQYYYDKYGLDIRSLRYPGVIGYQSLPGGGTTDYAVDIFHHAVRGDDYSCFLREDATLPMIYMDDAIRATIELMQAPREQISVRTSYNLAGLSFSPAELTAEIQRHYPSFSVSYQPDHRQQIADKWPKTIDDSVARSDWGWQPRYDLTTLCETMIAGLRDQYHQQDKDSLIRA